MFKVGDLVLVRNGPTFSIGEVVLILSDRGSVRLFLSMFKQVGAA